MSACGSNSRVQLFINYICALLRAKRTFYYSERSGQARSLLYHLRLGKFHYFVCFSILSIPFFRITTFVLFTNSVGVANLAIGFFSFSASVVSKASKLSPIGGRKNAISNVT